jgi:PAS domain S-box-containing protein
MLTPEPFEKMRLSHEPVKPPFGKWWRRQSPTRQDRYATLGPLVSVLLFLAAIIAAFWYLRGEEFERQAESVERDTEIAQQLIRLRLIESQEHLIRIAREISIGAVTPETFRIPATSFAGERSEIVHLIWTDERGTPKASYANTYLQIRPQNNDDEFSASLPSPLPGGEPNRAFTSVQKLRYPVYSGAYKNAYGQAVFQVQVPLIGGKNIFSGALIAEYSFDALVRNFVPTEVATRHMVALLDASNQIQASTVMLAPGKVARPAAIVHDVPLAPTNNGLKLRVQGYRTSLGLVSNTLFWMVVALSVLTVWMLLGTWRHMRRRSQMQSTLTSEANFRRAMENSMLTGMRAMDMDGRITYVNPAFCAMTGFSETELIGHLPPFPYWPKERHEENSRLLQEELEGRSPTGGIEVKAMQKNGPLFDARMYVSPLIDPKGVQTGWMTSMTNITEAKRVRDQLSASHERFTTVLEGLDAAVSVLSVQLGELLFANRSYRLWFGADPLGHSQLAGESGEHPELADLEDAVDSFGGLPATELTQAGTESTEVFIESLQKWFDVRTRYLQWTDGRLAQMLIATDITSRRTAETQAEQQAEKAQVTSRLVTMGEMASSVAHELNQPLTAISNYCSGMVSRVKTDAITKPDLIKALEKTAHQADRAGQIIRRIRAFVKRSEPQRQLARARTLIDETVDLAEIELRRRNVTLQVYVAQRLPPLMVDPILIEQVLLNLLKNSAEAIDNAQLPRSRRNIELRVVPKHLQPEGAMIEFTVTDSGPGLKDEVMARLYEAFFSTKVEGLGIGLSLCRSIIESHQGRIRAENLYNLGVATGCRFVFTLPVDTTLPPGFEPTII